MLLKTGYRYVYMSRKFAMRHGFIPQDAAPGHYGYSGLVKYVLLTFLLSMLIFFMHCKYRKVANHRWQD